MDLSTFDWNVFASILFMQESIAGGMLTTLSISLTVWVIGLTIGSILSEIKFHIISPFKWIIDFILWSYRCTPILLLIYYFYFFISLNGELLLSPFCAAVLGMSFWAIAYSAERFYCCRSYLAERKKEDNSNPTHLILFPIALKILIRIIWLSPVVSFIGVTDFLQTIIWVGRGYPAEEILLAGIIVYTIVIGIISIIAKILDILFKTPELLR